MAQLAVAGAGAAIGFAIGGPVGAQVGWAVGGVVGAVLFPPEGPTIEGPRLSDLNGGQTSAYGVPIPTVAGRFKGAGNVIWKAPIREVRSEREQGKGGGGPTYVEWRYYGSWAVGLCEWLIPPTNPGVLKIWFDAKLVYDTTGSSEVVSVPGLGWRFHAGTEEQLPDLLITATVGADRAPAHRGLCYIVFEDVPLETFGNRIPNVTVEIASEVTQSFPQVNSVPPASPLIADSVPCDLTYINDWPVNVAVDYRRGRIYEGRQVRTGFSGSSADFVIRVYDLLTMETISEHRCDAIAADYGGAGACLAPAHMHLAADGYLYACGRTAASIQNRLPLWKIDPDSWRAVGVFGPASGGGLGFGDNGAWLLNPMQITSVQVPRLAAEPLTFIIVQGTYSFAMVIDAYDMSYVWGAADSTIEPPALSGSLGISPLSYPIILVPGAASIFDGADLWYLRGSYDASPQQVEITRIRLTSGAASLGAGMAMGITRTDFTPVDIAAYVDPAASRIVLQSAWWDDTDQTLVITISGSGGPLGWGQFSTFKWSPSSGDVLWRKVGHSLSPLHDARGAQGRVLGALWGLGGNLVLQTGTGDELVNVAGAEFNNLFWLEEQQAVIGYREDGVGAKEIAKRYLTRAAPTALTVGQVVAALCERAGYEVSDYNVGALTDALRGYVLGRPMSARDAIQPLAAAFQFDAAEQDDVMLFRKRGGSAVATITYDDMVRESADEPVIQETRAQDADLPRELTVRFADVERGWEQGAQTWQRPLNPTATMTSRGVASLDMPIPITAAEAKTIAKRLCVSTWRERTRLQLAVGPAFSRLVPTDAVNVTTRDGATTRCRVGAVQDGANWSRRLELVTESAAAYDLTETEADSGDDWDEPAMPLPYYTRLIVPDLALITDGDDLGQAGLREYAFACAYDGARWRSVRLVRSADLATWSDLGYSTTPTSWGSVASLPAAPATPWTWDEAGELVVRMTDGEPQSATELEVLNWANMAALVGTDGSAEIIQWRDAADEGDGVFRLTGLLRGRRGTEDRIASRRAGDLFLLLDAQRAAFSAPASEAAATRYYRAVGIYETVNTAAATTTKSARGRAERPYALCQVTGTRDGSQNLTIAWVRRTRLGGEWLDGTGTVPLAEASEAYEVDVLNGPPAVARSYSANSGTAANAFDGSPSTEWIVGSSGLPRWLRVAFASAQTVRQYGIRARASSASTDSPQTFTFEGWDGAAWVVLDSRAAETGWTNGQLRTFALAAPASCTEFRLVVTAGSGGVNTGLAELELYRTVGGANIAGATYTQAVVRTITASTASASYSAANQTTDFGAAQAEVFVRLQQISALVGRGLPAEATL